MLKCNSWKTTRWVSMQIHMQWFTCLALGLGACGAREASQHASFTCWSRPQRRPLSFLHTQDGLGEAPSAQLLCPHCFLRAHWYVAPWATALHKLVTRRSLPLKRPQPSPPCSAPSRIRSASAAPPRSRRTFSSLPSVLPAMSLLSLTVAI